jgi:hypothetical protein
MQVINENLKIRAKNIKHNRFDHSYFVYMLYNKEII